MFFLPLASGLFAAGGRRARRWLMTGALSVLLPSTLMASETLLTPACEVREEYNDNILLSTIDRRTDFVTTVAPSLTLADRSQRHSISLTGGLNWLTYARTPGLEALDYLVRGQVGYRLSPRTDIGASGAYVIDSRPDSVNQLTGLSASAGSTAQNYSFRLGHKVDERTAGSLTYGYGRERYENPALQGNTVHTAGAALTRDLDNLWKGLASVGYSRTSYRTSRSEDYSLSLGLSWQPTESLTGSVLAGGRFTHSVFDQTGGEGSNDNWGVIGALTLAYTREKVRSEFSFMRDFAAASGQIGATERTAFRLALSRRFLEHLTGSATVSYTINSSPGGRFAAQEIEDRPLRITAGMQYEVNRYLALGATYSHYRIDYNIGNQRAVQNMVLLQATWQYPLENWPVIAH